jgi:DNA (cytosine-5)-methyltransferase 1
LQALKVLDLFSGIGGFSLGLERTGGFETVAFCEIEPFPRAVLKEHWPDVPCYEDVRTLTADQLRSDGIAVDVICGGFPCQDLSYAGKGAGLEGARSGLWSEIARLVGELRPQYVIVENVSALLSRGLGRVLGDLAEIGYDAEWHCIPASAVGAPHIRDRIWIIAYPQHSDTDSAGPYRAPIYQHLSAELRNQQEREPGSVCENVADAKSLTKREQTDETDAKPESGEARNQFGGGGSPVADAKITGLEGRCERRDISTVISRFGQSSGSINHNWRTEPDVGRVAHGVPFRVDRLKGLGNAVVPQIPEILGRAILANAYRYEASQPR